MKFLSKRTLYMFFLDIFVLILSCIISTLICRIDISNGNETVFELMSLIIISFFIYVIIFLFVGLYRKIWRYAQAVDFFYCIVTSTVAGVITFSVCLILLSIELPIHFYALNICISALGFVCERLLYRSIIITKSNSLPEKPVNLKKQRVLIVGAGSAANTFINEIVQSPCCIYNPVALLDDDPVKLNRSILGVPVLGCITNADKVAAACAADLVIIAIPSASNEQKLSIINNCIKTGLPIKTLPYLYMLNDNTNIIDKVREITPEELLGRPPINIADEAVLSFVCNKTVMVTGGGGSIGSELCRQIALHSPKKLVIIDNYENNIYEIEQELVQKYSSQLNLDVFIASVQDKIRLNNILAQEKPDIIFHAAAHKHVPLMETSSQEAVKNNILGTLNTAQSAINNGVSKFILISTDKAVNPTNIMGATKRTCELIIQSMNGISSTVFAAVRFGNVLGSNGSVIPLFKNQIRNGGPVTVTHPDITRYFMTIPEAAQLVICAGAMANGGEIFVLDMGQPVKIIDLAEKIIQLAGLRVNEDITIKYTGLRKGEKLYEELLHDSESLHKTANNKIFIEKPHIPDRESLFNHIEKLREITVKDSPDTDFLIENELSQITGTFYRMK